MRIYRNTTAIFVLATMLAACGGSHSIPSLNHHGSSGTMAQVAFSITLPPKTASARRPYYVSGNTTAANITVTQSATGYNQTTNITCSYPTCSGSVAAPIGADGFKVDLVDSANTVLSSGTASQTIAASSNTVNLTFNPIVASVWVGFDSISWNGGASPALDPNQHTSMVLDVNALDPDGQTIVGPGSFIDANGNAVTVTLSSSDTATTLSNTRFTAPGGTTTLAVKSGVQREAPYEDTIITASAPGVANVKGLAVAFAPILDDVGANSAFGAISGTYGDTAVAESGCSGDCTAQVDFNAVGSGGLAVVAAGPVQSNCGSVGNLTGGATDGMLYFNTMYGACGYPPPGGFTPNGLWQADPASHTVTEVASSGLLSGPLGVGADGHIWYVKTDEDASYNLVGILLCNYAVGSSSCTSDLPPSTTVNAFMPGPGGQTMAIINRGQGVALVSSSMAVTTHDLSGELNGIAFTSGTWAWGYSPADKQLYLWGNALATIDTTTWQVTSTTSVFPGTGDFSSAVETGIGPMTVLSDGSLVAAGGNGGGYGGGVNGVIFHIHPGTAGPIVSQEQPIMCATCEGIAGGSSLLPDGEITQPISSGSDIEYATW